MNAAGFCFPGAVVVVTVEDEVDVVVPAARCPLCELPWSVAVQVAFFPSRRAFSAANWF
jgi:hypothetical protein